MTSEFDILQTKAETLKKIDIALARFGRRSLSATATSCDAENAKQRLRALLFAVRCTSYEEVLEVERQREHVFASSRGVALGTSRI